MGHDRLLEHKGGHVRVRLGMDYFIGGVGSGYFYPFFGFPVSMVGQGRNTFGNNPDAAIDG